EEVPLRWDRERGAEDPQPELALSAEGVFVVLGPPAVAADVEVKAAVTVVVEERRTRRPETANGPATLGHVAKGTVTVIQVQGVSAEVREVEVRPPVVVHVADRGAVAKTVVADAGLLRHVLEPERAEVPVQPVAL